MAAGSQRAGLRQSERAAVGDDPGDPFSEIPGSLELRDLGWGAQGSEAAERGTRRPPRGCSPVAASGTRPPQGARGLSGERRRLSRVFRAIGLLVIRVHLTRLPRFRAEGIWMQALIFGEGSSRCPVPSKRVSLRPIRFFTGIPWASLGERLGSASATHTFPPSQAALPGSGDRLRAGSKNRKSQSQVF